MSTERTHWFSRLGLIIIILLSGVALLPIQELSAEKLNWQNVGAIYSPQLRLREDRGRPGSAFFYRATGYPPNTTATVYIDGSPRGTVPVNRRGQSYFLIQTEMNDDLDRYYVTLMVDANASATEDFRLEDDEPIVPPPPGYNGPIFFLTP